MEVKKDRCTLFPDLNYPDCCLVHDIEYFTHSCSKWRSDINLARCVWKKPKWYNKPLAIIMWLGVTVFGYYYWRKYGKAQTSNTSR